MISYSYFRNISLETTTNKKRFLYLEISVYDTICFQDYEKRRTIKETPCWIEIHLHRALQLCDEVLDFIQGGAQEDTLEFPGYRKTAAGFAGGGTARMELPKEPGGTDKEIILIDEGR